MNRRYLVLGLSVVLATTLVVPALGGPSNPVASSAASVAKALKKAKRAQATADTALSAANSAQSSANAAQGSANAAQTTADSAQSSANAAQSSANAANANANTRLQSTSTSSATSTEIASEDPKSVNVVCPSGDLVTGGGFGIGGTQTDISPDLSASYGNSWTASAHEGDATASNWSITSYVICAST